MAPGPTEATACRRQQQLISLLSIPKETQVTNLRFFSGALLTAITILTCTNAKPVHAAVSASEAKEIAIDAYIYGYSLITTEVTRVQMTNVPKVEELHAPLNAFANVHRYPPADYRGVSAPNADTLYSMGWLDLKEPVVFSHPDMGKRYYLFEVLDLWMRLLPDSPSSRTASG